MSGLRLVIKWKGSSSRPHDVVARIVGVDAPTPAEDVREVVVHASLSTAAQVPLPTGSYVVQVSLPSGEMLQERFDATVDELTPVVLEIHERGRGPARSTTTTDPGPASREKRTVRFGTARASRPVQAAKGAPPRMRSAEPERQGVRGVEPRSREFPLAAAANHFGAGGFGLAVGPEAVLAMFDGGGNPGRSRLEPTGNSHKLVSHRSTDRVNDVRARTWAVFGALDMLKIVSLPKPWPDQADGRPATIHVSTGRRESRTAAGSVTVSDGVFGGLLEYMGRGHLDPALRLAQTLDFRRLVEGTSQRSANPLGACGMAYVGLGVLDARRSMEWLAPEVLSSLRETYGWLPDGAVIEARYLMSMGSQDGRHDMVLDLLTEAFERGVPYYTAGVLHLREMLYALSENPEARAMCEAVSGIARHLDPRQALTTLRFRALRTGNRPDRGREGVETRFAGHLAPADG